MSSTPSPKAKNAAAGAPDFVEVTEQFLADLQTVSGIRIAVHDYAHLTQGRWPPSFYRHTCAYCEAAKRLPDGKRLCHEADVVAASEEARRKRAPFLRRCYAGVIEAIVPVFREDDLVAVVFCGQVFERANDGLKSIPLSIRRRMPLASPDLLMAVARLVDAYFRSNRVVVETLSDLRRASQYGPRRLMETLEWLEHSLESDLSVAEAARRAGLSLSHFEHLFKRHMHVSFSKWRRLRRLRMAKHLLIETDLKVREIAANVGYADASYFHRLFKQAEGMSPQDYRRAGKRASTEQNR